MSRAACWDALIAACGAAPRSMRARIAEQASGRRPAPG
jgi:hypothetical protein